MFSGIDFRAVERSRAGSDGLHVARVEGIGNVMLFERLGRWRAHGALGRPRSSCAAAMKPRDQNTDSGIAGVLRRSEASFRGPVSRGFRAHGSVVLEHGASVAGPGVAIIPSLGGGQCRCTARAGNPMWRASCVVGRDVRSRDRDDAGTAAGDGRRTDRKERCRHIRRGSGGEAPQVEHINAPVPGESSGGH